MYHSITYNRMLLYVGGNRADPAVRRARGQGPHRVQVTRQVQVENRTC